MRHALPAGWRKVRLSEVAEQSLGKMLDGAKNKGTPLPYLRNPNVRWFDFDLSDVKKMPFEDREGDRYGLRAGDVVICEGGEAGRAAIWDGRLPNMKFQKAIHRVRTGPELYSRFFVHRLMADYHSGRLADYYTGATIKHLTGQDLAQYEFELPPLAEQRRIAEILDKADALRAKRRAALAQLDTLTQSIFLGMFGDPVGVGWRMTTVAGIGAGAAAIRTGPFGSQLLHSEFVDDGVAVLGIDNAVENEFRWMQRRFITEAKYRKLSRYTVHPGDVLITLMGTCGRCAVVPTNVPLAINTKHLCCITVDRRKCLPEYLHSYFLIHPISQQYLRQTAKGAIMDGLNMGIIKEMPIPLAPVPLQKRYAELVKNLGEVRAVARRAELEIDKLFASLQHRAFRGEL